MIAAEATRATSPFKGLTPFEDSDLDAVLFFGREREREVIAANLLASRLTVLYGASGVGKSSVLRAGVAHRLRAMAKRNLETRGHPEFAVVVFDSWTLDPMAALLDEVEAEFGEVFGPELVSPDRAATPTDTLHDWTDRLDCDLLLVLDQTEEYFLYHEHEEGPGTLAGELPDLVTRPGLRVSVLLAIRDDALSRLDRFKARIPNLFANYLRLDHLDRRAGRAAIVGPIEQYNTLGREPRASIEPELVEALLDETTAGRVVVGQRGRGVVRQTGPRTRVEAAYLQLVLHRLWEEEVAASSNVLRLETLERLGGAEEVVRTHLERALAELTPEDKDVAADVFSHLVTPSGAKIAHGLQDLAEYAHVREERLGPIVSRLVSERILRPVVKAQNGGSNGSSDASPYEIFHDVLGEAVLAWRTTHESERRVAQERAEADRRHRRVVRILALAFVGLAAMTAVAAYAIAQRAEARRQADLATSQALVAEQQREKAELQEAKAVRASARERTAKQTALEERDNARRARDDATAQRVRAEQQEAVALSERDEATLQRATAEREKARAEELTVIARQQRASAVTARGRALAAKRAAERQKTRAQAGEYTALAQAALARDPVQSIKHALSAARLARNDRIEGVLRDGLLAVRLRAEVSGGGPLARAIFSRDGTTMATAAENGRVRLFRISARGRPSLLRTLRHSSAVATIAFSPDGRLVAAGGEDGKISVWDVASGFPRIQQSHTDVVTWVEFSPDGRVLASASEDRTARTWDVATGVPLQTLALPNGLRSARFSPDGRLLVTTPMIRDRFARVFDVATGRPVAELVHGGVVTSAQFTPDGSRVVSTGRRNLFIWERSSWSLRHPPLTGHTSAVHGAVVSPDSRRVLTYDDSGIARLWQIDTGDIVTVIQRHDNEITDADFQANGESIVTGSSDVTARVWDGNTGVLQTILAGHEQDVMAAAFHPTRDWILTASLDGTARLWDKTFEPLLKVIGRHAGGSATVAVAPDGKLVATGGADGAIHVRRVDGRLVRTLPHAGRINVVVFASAGRHLLTASEDGTARLWRVAGWRLLETFVHGSPVRFAAVSRDGGLVTTGAGDRTVKTWTSAGELLQTLPHAANLSTVVLDPAGRVLLTSALDGIARLWSTTTGAELHVLRHEDAIRAAAISPDGSRVATASADATARVWNTATGALLHTLVGHREELTAIAFSANGKRLVTAAANGHLRTWDVSNGKNLATFRGHVATVFGVGFSRDGRWVVSAGPSAAGLWIAETGKRMYFLRGHAANLSVAAFTRDSRRVVTAGADGTVRTYLCDICGNLAELRVLAKRRLNEIARVGFDQR